MFRGSFGGKPIFSSSHEAVNLAKLRKPVPPNFSRATSFTNPLGPEPGRGWILMLRADLDEIDRDADQELIFEFEQEDGTIEQRKLYKIIVASEPLCVTPSHTADDPDAIYLVEVADRRHLINSRQLQVATFNNYDFTNTWQQAITELWGLVGTHLGQASVPTLPITPPGTPINLNFIGESAWIELNRILVFLGLALRCNPMEPDIQFTIVQIGAAQADTDAVITALEASNRKIHDAEFVDVVRSRHPAGVRVYFPQHPEREPRNPVFVDVANPVMTGTPQPNLYIPVFDNTFAQHAADGTVLNQTALNTQAQSRATDYFRMIEEGGRRQWKRFSGLAELIPGANIKTVMWAHMPGTGIFTDIVNNPYMLPDDVGFIRKPLPVRTGYAPVRLWAVALPAYTRSGNTITFTANGSVTVDGSQTVVGDRVGVNLGSACTGHADNGIYEVQTVGNGVSGSGNQEVWRRALDADNHDDFRTGFTVEVASGKAHKGQTWFVWTDDPITLNTTAIWFAPKKFKAKLLARTASSCAIVSGSGSGSGSVAGNSTTINLYDFWAAERELTPGDCPQWGLQETGLRGVAKELNNLQIDSPAGIVVDIEVVFRKDLGPQSGSLAGSTVGDTCEYIFNGAAHVTPAMPCLKPWSFVKSFLQCVSGTWREVSQLLEWRPDSNGCFDKFETSLGSADTGICCTVCNSGSGSSATSCGSCLSDYCVTLNVPGVVPTPCNSIKNVQINLALWNLGCNGRPDGLFLTETQWSGFVSVPYSFVSVASLTITGTMSIFANLKRLCIASLSNPPQYRWILQVTFISVPVGGSGCHPGIVYVDLGTGSDPSTPPTLSGAMTECYCLGQNNPGTWSLATSACPVSSGGSCPCTWQWDGAVWVLNHGDSLCCTIPPSTPGTFVGEQRQTNCDGSTCSGGTGPTCAACGTTAAGATVSGASGWMTACSTFTAPSIGGSSFFTSITCFPSVFGFAVACIDNVWYAAWDGMATPVAANAGGTCGNLVFNFTNVTGPDGTLGSGTVTVAIS